MRLRGAFPGAENIYPAQFESEVTALTPPHSTWNSKLRKSPTNAPHRFVFRAALIDVGPQFSAINSLHYAREGDGGCVRAHGTRGYTSSILITDAE